MKSTTRSFLFLVCVMQSTAVGAVELPAQVYKVGLAAVDITPDYPVRLSGFAFRKEESAGVAQPIYAKALAIDDPSNGPALLMTVDNLGIPASMVREVGMRLNRLKGLKLERLTITATHTHTAPMLDDVAPNLFGTLIPFEHQIRIHRYTIELTEKLVQAGVDALETMAPGYLSHSTGTVDFAKNRRTKDGPVDHDLPVLFVHDSNRKLIGVFCSYACHCVTLSHNEIGGDWAGYAQSRIEESFPGVVAMVAIGCGADANPSPGVRWDATDLALNQGESIKNEILRLYSERHRQLDGPVEVRLGSVFLEFDTLPTLEEWESRAARDDAVGYHAKVNLARLKRGETLPHGLDYPIQTWSIGRGLCMVFLPGEVVVDYGLRLKKELDRTRTWIHAYANDVPCYIPSERILIEGGYEGGGAMVYYDRPTRFKSGLEDRIIRTVHELVPDTFKIPFGTDGTAPKPGWESLQCIQLADENLEIQLVAMEPQVIDPVAIDWGMDGSLWVAEMLDYPLGMKGNYEPGGRIRVLKDTNADQFYDQAELFLDQLPFPTGLMVYKDGVIVCSAPDILFARDTDSDGRADVVQKLFSGFPTHNYQARLNSLSWGLDNWVYGANGLLGGTIQSVRETSPTIQLNGHDFRMKPLEGVFETVSGLTQQGRARDDFGHWFGCDNGTLIRHYPVNEGYLHRQPLLAGPPSGQFHWLDPDPNQLWPISKPLRRFNDQFHLNRVTSACGLGLYRDALLGETYAGNAFVCEPVHNLVRGIRLERNGTSFHGSKLGGNHTEFLASADNWFRPVQIRTGPDGALWIVDMYRFLMEHPIWIHPERMKELDPRAGDKMGRIYRVVPKRLRPPLFPDAPPSITRWLDSSNGTLRDMAHQTIVVSGRVDAEADVRNILTNSSLAASRLQALCVLEGLKRVYPEDLLGALVDSNADIRTRAIRLSETLLSSSSILQEALLKMTNDVDIQVLTQLASTLGEMDHPGVASALAEIVSHAPDDVYLTASVLSATSRCLPEFTKILFERFEPAEIKHCVERLIPLATEPSQGQALFVVLDSLTQKSLLESDPESMRLLASCFHRIRMVYGDLDGLQRLYVDRSDRLIRDLKEIVLRSRNMVIDMEAGLEARQIALDLLGYFSFDNAIDFEVFEHLLKPHVPIPLQRDAAKAMQRMPNPLMASFLSDHFEGIPPSIRSGFVRYLQNKPDLSNAWMDLCIERRRRIVLSEEQAAVFLKHPEKSVRLKASKLFDYLSFSNSQNQWIKPEDILPLEGDAERGREVFVNRCASCHALKGMGTKLGPDLNELTDRSQAALLDSIQFPNKALLDIYLNYELELNNGETISGLIVEDGINSIRLGQANNPFLDVLRSDIKLLRSTGLSFMPEGLLEGLTMQDVADLISFVAPPKNMELPAPPPRDPATIAAFLMDPNIPLAERENAVRIHYALAPKLVQSMAGEVGMPEKDNLGVPWMLKVVLNASKRGEREAVKDLLDIVLPHEGEGGRLWQTAIVEGGLLQGLKEAEKSPREWVRESLRGEDGLERRWNEFLKHSDASTSQYPQSISRLVTGFKGNPSFWNGFPRFDFTFQNRSATMVAPYRETPGRPWIWRARFFGHEPQLDVGLLERGFHLVYVDVADLFGAPVAVRIWDEFYQYLVGEHHFAKKAVLEGMSRGGLILYNWAVANADKVACIYADAPVMDFKSWPGGERRRSETGQQQAWEKLKLAYGFKSDEEAFGYFSNPVDHAAKMAAFGIPLFHVCGAKDEVVPYADNTGLFKKRYLEAGGKNFQEIIKPETGHHPHSLPDPSPLTDFILRTCQTKGSPIGAGSR